MRLLLLASAGGAIGAGLRYLVNVGFADRGMASFPWGTLTVNVIGSFLMGIIAAFVFARADLSPELRTFVGTGILGGFTTFSAFSFDTMQLWSTRSPLEALGYVLATVILSIGALAVAMWFTHWLLPSLSRPVL